MLLGLFSQPDKPTVLLVRRTQRPYLAEVLAAHTNLHEVTLPPYQEPRKLDAGKLVQARKIITAAYEALDGSTADPSEGSSRKP